MKNKSFKNMKITTAAKENTFRYQNIEFKSFFKKNRITAAPIFGNFSTGSKIRGTKEDSFTKSIIKTDMPGPHGDTDIRGTIVKSIPLKDSNGKNIQGFIIQEVEDENCFYACTKENALCRMEIRPKQSLGGGYIYINALFGQENNGVIKGAGTELLKFAAQKSMDMGFDGRLELCMAGSYPFYFKNNFRTGRGYPDHQRKDAVLDYITRHNVPKDTVWKKDWDSPVMILDEKGAAALLEGRRLYDESKSETMYSKIIQCTEKNGREYSIDTDIDFCDFSTSDPKKNAYTIQAIIKSDENFYTQAAALNMELLEDENGKKYFDANNLYTEKLGKPLEDAVKDELFKAAEIKAKEFGAEYIRTENLNIKRE